MNISFRLHSFTNSSWLKFFMSGCLAIITVFLLAFYIRYELAERRLTEDFITSADKLENRVDLLDNLLKQRIFLLEHSSAMQRVINDPSELATVGLLSEWSKFYRNFKFKDQLYYLNLNGEIILRLEPTSGEPLISWGKDKTTALTRYFSSIKWAIPGQVYQHKLGVGKNTRYLIYLGAFDKWATLNGFIVQEFTQLQLNRLVNQLANKPIGPYLTIMQSNGWNSYSSKSNKTLANLKLNINAEKNDVLNYEKIQAWQQEQAKKGPKIITGRPGLFLLKSLSGFLTSKPILLMSYVEPSNVFVYIRSWLVFWALALLLSISSMAFVAYLWCQRQSQQQKIDYNHALHQAAFEGDFSQVIADQDGKVIAVNNFHCKLIGMRKEDVLGLHADAFMTEMTPSLEYLIETAKEYSGWKGEISWFDSQGEIHYMMSNISIIYNAQGIIERYVVSGVDISAQKALEIKLQELADTDSLTGCFNRRAFEQALTREYSRTIRTKNKFSLIMLDIDHFKSINDHYGHDIGDQVLVALVSELNKHIRSADILARWGGEEFLLLLPETTGDQAVLLAERLRKALENNSQHPTFTASFGVCETDGSVSSVDLLHKIDSVLYQAKLLGRNRVVCAEPEPEIIELEAVDESEIEVNKDNVNRDDKPNC